MKNFRLIQGTYAAAILTCLCATGFASGNPYESNIVAWGSFKFLTRPVTAISAAEDYVLALQDDSTVVGWGYVTEGQTTIPSDLGPVAAIAAGDHHALVLLADGTVRGWGTSPDGRTKLDPAKSKFTAIAAGSYHSIGLRADGTVAVSGKNDSGQSTVPYGLKNVVAVAVGEAHSMALLKNGTVVVWGGGKSSLSIVPANLANVKAIFAGANSCHALTVDDVLVSWGRTGLPSETNDVELYASSYAGSIWRTKDDTLRGWVNRLASKDRTGIKQIDVGNMHFVALRNDGTVVVWGDSSKAQAPVPAGRDDIASIRATPNYLMATTTAGGLLAWQTGSVGPSIPAANPGSIQSVAAGKTNTIALRTDSMVRYWTRPAYASIATPTAYPGLDKCKAVAAGNSHYVVLQDNGTLFGWGDDSKGQIDFQDMTETVMKIDATDSVTMALGIDGSVHIWGGDGIGPQSVPLDIKPAKDIAAGTNHFLAIRGSGYVTAWGRCPANLCALPGPMDQAKAISAGPRHSLAIQLDGKVFAWGDSTDGKLHVPTNLGPANAVAAGATYSAVLLERITSSTKDRTPLSNPMEKGFYEATIHDLRGGTIWTGRARWNGARWSTDFARAGTWILRASVGRRILSSTVAIVD